MENWILTTALIACSLLYAFCAAEGTCTTAYQAGCLKRITIIFEERIVTEKREFTIYYKEAVDKNVIAECDLLRFGHFQCNEKEGFNCDEELKTNFSIEINDTIRCLHTGELQLDVAHEGIIRCDVSLKPIKVPDSHHSDVARKVAEGVCKMDYESGCLKTMSIQFEERIVTEKREFTIYYKETEDENEVIADCYWPSFGNFDCNEKEGFTCDEELRTNFSVVIQYTVRCLRTGKFQLDVAHEESITCNVSPHQIEKKASESHLNETKREEEKMDVTGTVTGVIISSSALIMILVLVYILKRRGIFLRFKSKQKRKSRKGLSFSSLNNPATETSDATLKTAQDSERLKEDAVIAVLRSVKTRFPVEVETKEESTENDTDLDHRDIYPASASDEDEL